MHASLNPTPADADSLYHAFTKAWQIHTHHPWRARWVRRHVAGALLLQRLGVNRSVKALLFWGANMRVLTGETVSTGLLGFGFAEPTITALLCELLPAGAMAVDIGAHFGYEAMLMSLLVGRHGRVHSFEPNPAVWEFARDNLAPFPQTTVHQVALSNASGRAVFHFPPLALSAFGGLDSSTPSVAYCAEVTIATLDGFLAGDTAPISVLKCDAEGQEELILRGMPRRLAADRPALILETGMPSPDGSVPPGILTMERLLVPLGYHAFCFDFDGLLKVARWGTFAAEHANSLFLHEDHPRFSVFTQGWSRQA